jgi:hypothetical protein
MFTFLSFFSSSNSAAVRLWTVLLFSGCWNSGLPLGTGDSAPGLTGKEVAPQKVWFDSQGGRQTGRNVLLVLVHFAMRSGEGEEEIFRGHEIWDWTKDILAERLSVSSLDSGHHYCDIWYLEGWKAFCSPYFGQCTDQFFVLNLDSFFFFYPKNATVE